MTEAEIIEGKIKELEERITAGDLIIKTCQKQMKVLKRKVKEFVRLKYQVNILSAADGDL